MILAGDFLGRTQISTLFIYLLLSLSLAQIQKQISSQNDRLKAKKAAIIHAWSLAHTQPSWFLNQGTSRDCKMVSMMMNNHHQEKEKKKKKLWFFYLLLIHFEEHNTFWFVFEQIECSLISLGKTRLSKEGIHRIGLGRGWFLSLKLTLHSEIRYNGRPWSTYLFNLHYLHLIVVSWKHVICSSIDTLASFPSQCMH